MEYGCSQCDYFSFSKKDVLRHFKKKNPCSDLDREVIERPRDFTCDYCKKKFSSFQTLSTHKKRSCVYKLEYLKDEISILKTKLSSMSTEPTETIEELNDYEETSLEKITDEIYSRIIEDTEEVYKIISEFIKYVHFNPDIPENHNVYLSNRSTNNKYLSVYRNGRWEITDKDTEICNMIYDKETNISDWIGEKGKKFPGAVEKFNGYCDQKFDSDVQLLIKHEVELTLYNNRNCIMKIKKNNSTSKHSK